MTPCSLIVCSRGAYLQDAEDNETEEEEDSQADGFVVDDGYLSEGEGAPIDNVDFGAEVEGACCLRYSG